MNYDYDRRVAARAIPVDKPAIHELAREVEALVAKKLEHKTGPVGKMTFGTLPHEIRAVDGSRRKVWVRVQSVPSRDVRYFVSGGAGTLRGDLAVVLNVNASLDAEVIWKATHAKTTESFIFPILLHELTHAADVYAREVGMSEDEAEGNSAYYNNPSEVRAYMQEILEEVSQRRSFFPKLKARFGDRALGMLLNMSTTWGEVSPHWTRANQQKVLKAVYQILESEGAG